MLPSGEIIYTSRGGHKVVRYYTMKGNTLRILTPRGGWLCGNGRVLTFRSVATACQRADKEDRELAAATRATYTLRVRRD
jgi:hypothetical protein